MVRAGHPTTADGGIAGDFPAMHGKVPVVVHSATVMQGGVASYLASGHISVDG